MEAFAGTDGLGNPSYVVVGKRWGAGAARTEERDVRKKEARYPNTINKLSQFAAGENNAFDAGMMREKVTVSAEPTNGGDRLEFTRQGVYNRWLDFGPSLLRVCMTATAATTGEPAETDFVVRQSATLFDAQSPLVLASGETLGPITVAFQTYGELTPARDNAIFICHALTGDAHVAGRHQADERKPGWWDGFVGPGKAIDTDRYFVICANILGGCQGTTGPACENPATGVPYGPDFPFLTVADIVTVHQSLVDHLEIDRLLSVIGGSLGGMQVLEWAARFPDRIASAIVLASGAKLNAQGIAFNAVGRRAIYADPHFNEGRYYGQEEAPRFGLALARMIAHITYLSEQSIESKFGRRLQDSAQLTYDLLKETEFQIESYLHYQGKRFVERFDANSYLLLTRAMDYFDLVETHGPMHRALGKTDARFLVVSYTTDWLFPTAQSRAIVRALLESGRHVSFAELESPHGHDAFLIDDQLPMLAALVEPFLQTTYEDVRAKN